ncbi:MAG: hypothetical protein AAGD13_05125 [Pseudomonadota bacterium]
MTGTTINELVDRPGGAYSQEDLENSIANARKLLADTAKMLQFEVDRHFETEVDRLDETQLRDIRNQIAQAQKGIQQILDLESKIGLTKLVGGKELDLEDARAEILRRLARLAS